MLVAYTDNRVAIATASREEALAMLPANNRLITDLWTATVAAFPSMKNLDFSSSYLETMNNLIDLDASRKAARQAKVPSEVFFVLFIYIIAAAGVLGYVLVGSRARAAASVLFLLFMLSLLLIVDIDRPTGAGSMNHAGSDARRYLRASLAQRRAARNFRPAEGCVAVSRTLRLTSAAYARRQRLKSGPHTRSLLCRSLPHCVSWGPRARCRKSEHGWRTPIEP
jgi:hypothetical protein